MKKTSKFILRLIKVDQGLEKAWVFLAYIALVNKITRFSHGVYGRKKVFFFIKKIKGVV